MRRPSVISARLRMRGSWAVPPGFTSLAHPQVHLLTHCCLKCSSRTRSAIGTRAGLSTTDCGQEREFDSIGGDPPRALPDSRRRRRPGRAGGYPVGASDTVRGRCRGVRWLACHLDSEGSEWSLGSAVRRHEAESAYRRTCVTVGSLFHYARVDGYGANPSGRRLGIDGSPPLSEPRLPSPFGAPSTLRDATR